MQKHPFCREHKQKAPQELLELLESIKEFIPSSQIRPIFNSASYEVEFFRVKYLGLDTNNKCMFKFKNKTQHIIFNTDKKLELNKEYIILADYYYTLSDTAVNNVHLSVFDIKPMTGLDYEIFNGLSETHENTVFICHPIQNSNNNFGLALKCKETTREKIHKAIINDSGYYLTKDIVNIFINPKMSGVYNEL